MDEPSVDRYRPELDDDPNDRDIEHLDDPELWKPIIGNPTAEFDATVTMRNALEASVNTIVEVARGETVSRLRFDASKYLVERILGKPAEGGSDSPWDKMLAALRDDVSDTSGSSPSSLTKPAPKAPSKKISPPDYGADSE